MHALKSASFHFIFRMKWCAMKFLKMKSSVRKNKTPNCSWNFIYFISTKNHYMCDIHFECVLQIKWTQFIFSFVKLEYRDLCCFYCRLLLLLLSMSHDKYNRIITQSVKLIASSFNLNWMNTELIVIGFDLNWIFFFSIFFWMLLLLLLSFSSFKNVELMINCHASNGISRITHQKKIIAHATYVQIH